MDRSVNRYKITKIIFVLTLIFIWGHSLLSRSISSIESRTMTELVYGTGVYEYLIRKYAHLLEFSVLGFELFLLAPVLPLRLIFSNNSGDIPFLHYLAALNLGGIIAFIDETFQYLSGRSPEIRDVWIDLLGAFFGLCIGLAGKKLWKVLNSQSDLSVTLVPMLRLALPAVLQNIMGTIMQYVDTAMVGHLGEKATAAVSTTTTVGWLVGSLPYSFAIGALTLISQAYGAGDRERIKRCSKLAVISGIVIGAVLTALTLGLSPFIPTWMHADPSIRESASRYFFIVNLVMLPRAVSILMTTSLQAVKDTKTPMLIGLISNGLNIVLNGLLIYGCALGVTGAAIATAVSNLVSSILIIVVFFRNEWLRFRPGNLSDFEGIRRNWELFKTMAGIALPALFNSAAGCLGHVVFASMVNGMGTTIFAAHSLALSAEEFFYMPGYGIRTATSTLIGNAVGERNEKKVKQVRNTSIQLTVSLMFVNGLILFFNAALLMRIFTNSQAVVLLGAEILRFVAFSEPFFGLKIAGEGVSVGLGRTKSVFIIETLCMWGIRILSTYIVINYLGLGLSAVWCCMIADNACAAILLTINGKYIWRLQYDM
ncbi:MAG: MATE family efflux transporter [Lachnospiraceae bacterium]|nr:MATE family efflux transporter [Lachnospiraceae bacterium]